MNPAPAIPAQGQTETRPKLLYLVTEDWYFCSHRIAHARAARDAGFEVVVAAHVNDQKVNDSPVYGETAATQIRAEGFRLVPLALDRSGRNPLHELAAIAELVRLYARERPDLTQHVALKPALYGSIAARLTGVPAYVNSIAGLGYVFVSRDFLAYLLRPFIRFALRLLLNHKRGHVIVQNPDDREALEIAGIARPGHITLIPGSGVDTETFTPSPPPPTNKDSPPLAVLASRMLWDKGVGELVAAARILKEKGVALRVALIGEPDPANPASIPRQTLEEWQREGAVEWWGQRSGMAEILKTAHIAVLPSYREGLPLSLLEAASCARPLIASNVPGCREIVRHGKNGLLVPARDSEALATALSQLAQDPQLREKMGGEARRLVEERFARPLITAQTVALYKTLAGQAPA
ncbi:MAG: glycosyltransferase family 4 protein [Alphaproteobacteria bacterium]|jgi:glycosyltransferase involved in cell wall biosynthesis|nr:glycosyltransferase family 4 protein [Alphaproteobacteria bacterium]|tara:strand:- start:226 stop:1452 length:1227 start_codon:yes stop_codon:yes gene_type:complete